MAQMWLFPLVFGPEIRTHLAFTKKARQKSGSKMAVHHGRKSRHSVPEASCSWTYGAGFGACTP